MIAGRCGIALQLIELLLFRVRNVLRTSYVQIRLAVELRVTIYHVKEIEVPAPQSRDCWHFLPQSHAYAFEHEQF